MENSNQPAFANKGFTGSNFHLNGLTKREYFAAMAMQGLCANHDWVKSADLSNDWDDYIERLTKGSVEIADALLEELDKK